MKFESTGIEILFLFCSDVEAVLKALLDAIALPERGRIHELLVLAEALRFDFFLIDWQMRFGVSFVLGCGGWYVLLAVGRARHHELLVGKLPHVNLILDRIEHQLSVI